LVFLLRFLYPLCFHFMKFFQFSNGFTELQFYLFNFLTYFSPTFAGQRVSPDHWRLRRDDLWTARDVSTTVPGRAHVWTARWQSCSLSRNTRKNSNIYFLFLIRIYTQHHRKLSPPLPTCVCRAFRYSVRRRCSYSCSLVRCRLILEIFVRACIYFSWKLLVVIQWFQTQNWKNQKSPTRQ
jgi:hypothetical protein